MASPHLVSHLVSTAPTPASGTLQTVYLFADHLDAALAHGEDLLAMSLAQGVMTTDRPGHAIVDEVATLKAFVSSIRTREMALTLRLAQAQRRMSAVVSSTAAKKASLLAQSLALFGTTVGALTSSASRLGDGHVEALESGYDCVAFLASRGLTAQLEPREDSPAPVVMITEEFPVAGVLPLGPLLDVIARTLDVLDATFGLYSDDETPRAIGAFQPRPVAAANQPLEVRPPSSHQSSHQSSQLSAALVSASARPTICDSEPMSAADRAVAAAVALAMPHTPV